MPGSGAAVAYGSGMAGSENGNLETVVIVGSYTTSTEAFSVTKGQTGFSIGTFSSGVATITCPKDFKALGGYATLSIDARKGTLYSSNPAAGTIVLKLETNAGTAQDPGTSCTVTLFIQGVRK